MSPREFMSVYGTPVAITVVPPAGVPFFIQPDPDRYLFVLWGVLGDTEVRPGVDPGLEAAPLVFNPNDDPLVFDHAHVGAMAGLGWTLFHTTVNNRITYLVGRMVPIVRRPTPRRMSRAKGS